MPVRKLVSVAYDLQAEGLSVKLLSQPRSIAAPSSDRPVTYAEVVGYGWGVLEDCLLVTEAAPGLLPWLTDQLLPALQAAGIGHWGWVCGPNLLSHQLGQQVVSRLPHVAITVFHDLEHAVSWLQHDHRLRGSQYQR